jgi:hypothetical protein
MDYRALGELIWFSLLGLSVLTLVAGVSVRVFLAPVVREVLGKLRSDADRQQQLLGVRVERTEERLSELETQLNRLAAAEEFHRQLRAGPDEGD